jgi:hypothetical protein
MISTYLLASASLAFFKQKKKWYLKSLLGVGNSV